MQKLIEEEHTILQNFKGKVSKIGRFTGIEKNKYGLVKNYKTVEDNSEWNEKVDVSDIVESED
jgi:hypothetical protein